MKQKEIIREKIDGQSPLKERNKAQTIRFECERFSFYELGEGTFIIPASDLVNAVCIFSLVELTDVEILCGKLYKKVNGGEYNSCILNKSEDLKLKATSRKSSFCITLSPEFKQQIAGNNFKNEGSDSLQMISQQNFHITPEMRSIANELFTCKRKGMLKQLFFESKVLKLLVLQFEQYEQSQKKSLQFIKEYDVEKIHQAKFILDGSIAKAVTVVELAHQVGLNDFKLKRGFKEIFNTTVYNYLYEQRMLEAKKLLLGTSISINEIAMNCGYEFVQSFIKAFKRKYDLPPEKFRNSNESQSIT